MILIMTIPLKINYKEYLIVIMQYPGNKGLSVAERKILNLKMIIQILFILLLLKKVHLELILYYHIEIIIL